MRRVAPIALLSFVACGGDDHAAAGDAGAGADVLEGVHLNVRDRQARSCELIVVDPKGAVARVDFSDEVLGSSVSQGPKVALSFLRKADAAIAASAVTLRVRASAGADDLSTKAVACFDKDGKPLEGAEVTIVH